jgi:predicted O-linked N-acetylglucosamine transferase (SPINDLY family)
VISDIRLLTPISREAKRLMRKPNRPAKPPRTAPAARPKPANQADSARLEEDLRARLAAEPEDKAAWQQLAGILANSRRPKEAVDAFAKAVALGAPIGPICTPYAIALSNLGRHKEAAELVAPVHARKPKDFALTNLLGVMLKRAGRLDEAAAMLQAAQKLDPKSASPWQNLGNVEEARGDYAAAAKAFQEGVRLDPRNGEIWRLLARMRRALGDVAAARAGFEKAFEFQPKDRNTLNDLMGLLIDQGDIAGAIPVVARARKFHAGDRGLDVMHARMLLRLGQREEARAVIDGILAEDPGERQANLFLSRMAGDGDRRLANEALKRAHEANPDAAEIQSAYIESLSRSRYDDEVGHLEESYRLSMDFMRRHPDKVARSSRSLRTVFQRVMDLDQLDATGAIPDLLPVWQAEGRHSSVHYELGQVHSLEERIAIVEWHRNWGRNVLRRIKPVPAAPALHMPRKWRIGYLSSDLRNHPVTYFCMPLLEEYDRDQFEIFCYSFYEGERDVIQAELEKAVNFRWWPHRPDDQVAADIAKDNLDLLFELGGSTAMNKLEVMAYRPARLGGSWLGYPHSAGLETIDYILVDPYIKPEDPRLLIEKPFELPETWVTIGGRLGFYEVPIDLEIPQDRRGFVTFGTANNPYKYTRLCIDTWAAVLRRVPNSRFIFIRPEAGGVSFVENTRNAFAERNVDPDRIEFVGIRGKHLPHYNKMDISLDTLPHVGGTTTCESLWMGVPCISLVGAGFAERLSYSNLSNAGVGDLATFSIEAYIEKAAELAADAPRRRVLRHGLRDMIRAMPLGQPARFGKAFYDKAAEVCAL